MTHAAPPVRPDDVRRGWPVPSLALTVAAAGCYYAWLMIVLGRTFTRERPAVDVTFNSMLDHLLRGRFDVDPLIIGTEGFARNGQVFAYWGPLPALFRLPLIGTDGWQRIDITLWSCLLAAVVAAAAKLWTLRLVMRATPGLPKWLGSALTVALLLSGAQICFLRPSLYQEVCLWAGAFAAIFVAAAMAARVHGFAGRHGAVMAAAAGAALLTRVSTAIGLIAAFGLVAAVVVARRPAALRALGVPVLILAIAGLATGYVNLQRWGDPFTFADYHHYLSNPLYPDRVMRMERDGLFSLVRMPFGLIYYFAPIWVLPTGEGGLLLAGVRERLVDVVELPPSSFLLTDPALLLLGAAAIARARRPRPESAALVAGLALPAVLMLTAVSMCFRYRLDFYPLIEGAAFLGLAAAGASRPIADGKRWIVGLVAVGTIASHLVLTLYYVSDYGPPERLLRSGALSYYAARLGVP